MKLGVDGFRGEPRGWPRAPPPHPRHTHSDPRRREKELRAQAGMCQGCGRSMLGVQPSPTFPKAGNEPRVRGWAGGLQPKSFSPSKV